MRNALIMMLAAASLLAAGCGASIVGNETDGGSDAGADAGSVDGGDADGGEADAGNADAGILDAGEADAGNVDAGNVDAGNVDAGSVDAGTADAGSVDGGALDGGGSVADPNLDGPYSVRTLDDTINVAASGDRGVPIHCVYPVGPAPGSAPVVVVAHGLSIPASQYYGYVTRLASFGYVALTVDYPASVFSVNNTKEAQDLLAGLDWAATNVTVSAIANTQLAGMTGHSLGGKLALLAATMDARIKAVITLDPVDGGQGSCTAPACIEVAPLLPGLAIPTGFLGETTDASGGLQPCAPAASNFTTFYAKANAPSLEVTVLGASHVSFVDNQGSCGVVCALCVAGSASNAQVVGLAHAYVAAFYERWLRGNLAYDAYLTGAIAQARYVASNEATITSR